LADLTADARGKLDLTIVDLEGDFDVAIVNIFGPLRSTIGDKDKATTKKNKKVKKSK